MPDWTVEQRMRLTMVYLETMVAVAKLATEAGQPVPGCDTREELAEWMIRMAQATGRQVGAIDYALPLSCKDVEVPM